MPTGGISGERWQRNPASLAGSYANNMTLPMLLGKLRLLRDKNIPAIMTPQDIGPVMESWGAGETGNESWPRPAALPINKDGVQIFANEKVKPLDMAGDVAGHFYMNKDSPNYNPEIGKLYDDYVKSLNPEMMMARYEYAKKNFGESRPFDVWLNSSGAPSMMRGYVFRQWPEEFNRKVNSPAQIQMLDQIISKLGVNQ